MEWEEKRQGTLHHPSKWDGLTITRLPMGHSVSVTPMQIHMAVSAVANEGVLMKPRFINRVFDERGKTVVVFDPKPVRRVLDINVAKNLTNMLVDVVSNEGTARQAVIDGLELQERQVLHKKLSMENIQQTSCSFICGIFSRRKP